MKASSAKQKGKLLEDYVADRIIFYGLDDKARRDSASGAGNREKGDVCTSVKISGANVGIECKNHKNAKIQDWWRQTQKLEKTGRVPILVYKLGGEGLGDAKAVVYLDTLLDLISHQSTEDYSQNTGLTFQDKYVVKNAIEANKKLLKLMEEL